MHTPALRGDVSGLGGLGLVAREALPGGLPSHLQRCADLRPGMAGLACSDDCVARRLVDSALERTQFDQTADGIGWPVAMSGQLQLRRVLDGKCLAVTHGGVDCQAALTAGYASDRCVSGADSPNGA